MIHADILLQWEEEADRRRQQNLQKYLKSGKGKGVQGVLDVGRAFLG